VNLKGLSPELINDISQRLIDLKNKYPVFWDGIKTVNRKKDFDVSMMNRTRPNQDKKIIEHITYKPCTP